MEEELHIYRTATERRETALIKKIIVVRHGESVANTKGIYQGQTYDTDLSELGQKQAKALAERLEYLDIKKIVTSPLRRTYQTAMEVSKVVNIPVEVNADILETNHGIWEGKKKEWIESNFPGVYKLWLNNPKEVSFPGGELFSETFERVNNFLENLDAEDGTLIVTHDNIVRIMISLAEELDLNDIWRHTIEPAGLNFFEINNMNGKKKLKILKLNDNEHLKGLGTDLTKHAL